MPRTISKSFITGTGLKKCRPTTCSPPPAAEAISVARCDDPLVLARTCYHLGNRHVPLQVLPGEARYLGDPVLDAMAEKQGADVQHASLPFAPEPGAYEAGHDGSGHSHAKHSHGS